VVYNMAVSPKINLVLMTIQLVVILWEFLSRQIYARPTRESGEILYAFRSADSDRWVIFYDITTHPGQSDARCTPGMYDFYVR
jgi:hypothetical protein